MTPLRLITVGLSVALQLLIGTALSAQVLTGVKIIKWVPGPQAFPAIRIVSGCETCTIPQLPHLFGQNNREWFFHIYSPLATSPRLTVEVAIKQDKINRVIVEKDEARWNPAPNGIVIDIPGFSGQTQTTELHSHLFSEGLDVRVEHADPRRRNGRYATGPWPTVQIAAALNLEFALRESVRELGLGRYIAREGLGTLLIMGFDTNFPAQSMESGHTDYPPHIHMHLMWPHRTGTQVGHFYINAAGLITNNAVSLIGYWDFAAKEYKSSEEARTIDYLGREVYKMTVLKEGGLTVINRDGARCEITPAETGFQRGAVVRCNLVRRTVRVTDDVERGHMVIFLDGLEKETYDYDPDTAMILRSAKH